MKRNKRRLARKTDAKPNRNAATEVQTAFAGAIGHHRMGRLAEAEQLYRQVLAADPRHADALNLLGVLAYQSGRIDDAVDLIGRAIGVDGGIAPYYSNLGVALRDLGRLDEAAAAYGTAIRLQPDYAEAYSNLGIVLTRQGRLDEAVAAYDAAIRIRPDYAEAHYNRGSGLARQGRLEEAAAAFDDAIRLRPDYAAAHYNRGNALADQGRLDEAADAYGAAIAFKPDYADAYHNLLFLRAVGTGFDAARYFALARRWEAECVPPSPARFAAPPPPAGRRLRLGYVSGDFRQHPVSQFIEPLFTHHDRDRVELFAYATVAEEDETTIRLRALAEHWVPLAGLSDEAARARIAADGIDVLVDLSGHTRFNRLGVFALRAAPVQVHYLGFPGSTGLSQMDYWIGDDVLTPPDTDGQFSETVWRLPRVWVSYGSRNEAPPPGWQPAEDGTLWLGSFNKLTKLTPGTIDLWAQVLHLLPEGRLLLKTRELADPPVRRRVLESFAARGVAGDRIELADHRATVSWRSHMAWYDRVDVALDPVGAMGGATTTCDALWMGVPVVTLEGDRMATRMTMSMLHAVGGGDWVARSGAEYIDKAVALARNVDLRRSLRAGLRSRMEAGPLCDAAGLARALEDAYVAMADRRRTGGGV